MSKTTGRITKNNAANGQMGMKIEDLADDFYVDEMIELEYMLANMGNETKAKKPAPLTKAEEENKQRERKRLAAVVIALGIEAELPVQFYEKLLKSKRAKSLIRTIANDDKANELIQKLYKC